MDNANTPKPDAEKEAAKKNDTMERDQVCTKPFDPENARSGDKDAPCKNGED